MDPNFAGTLSRDGRGRAPRTARLGARRLASLVMGFVLACLVTAEVGLAGALARTARTTTGTLVARGAGTLTLGDAMPGDGVSRQIRVDVEGTVECVVGLEWTGARELAAHVEITLSRGPEIVYRARLVDGPWTLLSESMTDESADLTLTATLSNSAGNEAQGKNVGLRVIVVSTEDLSPEADVGSD